MNSRFSDIIKKEHGLQRLCPGLTGSLKLIKTNAASEKRFSKSAELRSISPPIATVCCRLGVHREASGGAQCTALSFLPSATEVLVEKEGGREGEKENASAFRRLGVLGYVVQHRLGSEN